ncbi:integral membrane protein [Bordetella ansorpii]|uniref:Integral membrane protein n=1 Tax=Bordetella ansorpii TaxID=288768 RepID=A0A157SEP7_9BORD|nr:DMT family transporter [Bordetella ansorpii]SAI68910.1 integral membrane protein [Bordetella ansorpii]
MKSGALSAPVAARTGDLATGVLCGLAVALIWSGWSVATRFAVTTNLRPQDVTFLRFGVSALLLWPILARKGLGLAEVGVVRMLVMLVGAGVPFMLLGSIGMRYAPAAHVATLMIGAMPIFVALLMVAFFGERFSRLQTLGIGSVVIGVACIGGYALVMNRAAGEWRGDLLFMLAGLLFASFTIAQRRSGISPWHATALVNVGSAVLFTPIYFLWLEPRIFTAPLPAVAFQVVAQGVFVAILGMYFYAQAVRRLGAARGAIFGALAPAFAVLLGMLVLDEYPAAITVAGIVLVMGGVLLVVNGARAKPTGHSPPKR